MCDRILVFSRNPGHVISEIAVDLPQPRNRLEPRFRDLVERIYDELAKAVNTPAVKEKLSGQGIDVSGAPGSDLDAFVRKEIARWAKVVKDNNIKMGD